MGSYFSKFLLDYDDCEKKSSRIPPQKIPEFNEEQLCTPPRSFQKKLIKDPRSATLGIERTPIEIESDTPDGSFRRNRNLSAIPKYLQSKPYLETNLDIVIPPLSPRKLTPQVQDESSDNEYFTPIETRVIEKSSNLKANDNIPTIITPIELERYKILGIDPRSPAANFDRTPILIPKSLRKLQARSHENLHKQGSFDIDPVTASKFLSSETIVDHTKQTPADQKREIEIENTQADSANEERELNSSSDTSRETVSDNEEQVTMIKLSEVKICHGSLDKSITKPLFPSFVLLDQPVLQLNKQDSQPVNVQSQNNKDEIQIWEDETSLEDRNSHGDIEISEGEGPKISQQDISIIFDDHTIPESKQSSEVKTDNQSMNDTLKKKKLSNAARKIPTEDIKFMSNEKNTTETVKSRIPLRNRCNNTRISTLGVSSPRIQLNKGSKMHQENTPPNIKCISKANLSKMNWDCDSTVII